MKNFIPYYVALMLLSGCAGTKLTDPKTGRTLFRTQGDMGEIEVVTSDIRLTAKQVNHSLPTAAGGDAFAKGATTVGTGIIGATTALGQSGLITKTAAIAVPAFINKQPKPTPAPNKPPK